MNVDLAQLASLPEAVRQLQARVEQLEAMVAKPQAEDLLDADAVAKRLGMTPKAVRQAAWRGSLPCVRVGRQLRFRPSQLPR